MWHFLTRGAQTLFPLVSRDSKWASHHAVPATHATVFRINNRPRRGFPEGPHRANGNTGRILTVHAEAADVHASAGLHHVQCVGREFFVAGFVHRKVSVRSESS